MTDLLRLLAGPRFCPWCNPGRYDFSDWIADHAPLWVIWLLMPYWRLVGSAGMPLHDRLHEQGARQ